MTHAPHYVPIPAAIKSEIDNAFSNPGKVVLATVFVKAAHDVEEKLQEDNFKRFIRSNGYEVLFLLLLLSLSLSLSFSFSLSLFFSFLFFSFSIDLAFFDLGWLFFFPFLPLFPSFSLSLFFLKLMFGQSQEYRKSSGNENLMLCKLQGEKLIHGPIRVLYYDPFAKSVCFIDLIWE